MPYSEVMKRVPWASFVSGPNVAVVHVEQLSQDLKTVQRLLCPRGQERQHNSEVGISRYCQPLPPFPHVNSRSTRNALSPDASELFASPELQRRVYSIYME